MSEIEKSARRFGWTALFAYALIGTALEAAHGFKLAAYLDDELARMLLRLAHAHGVGLSLVVLVFSSAGASHPSARSIFLGLAFAAVAIPIGFGAAAFAHPEGDPGFPIFLVPIGAIALLISLARLAWHAWRS